MSHAKQKCIFQAYADIEVPDQPAHLCSLIRSLLSIDIFLKYPTPQLIDSQCADQGPVVQS